MARRCIRARKKVDKGKVKKKEFGDGGGSEPRKYTKLKLASHFIIKTWTENWIIKSLSYFLFFFFAVVPSCESTKRRTASP